MMNSSYEQFQQDSSQTTLHVKLHSLRLKAWIFHYYPDIQFKEDNWIKILKQTFFYNFNPFLQSNFMSDLRW